MTSYVITLLKFMVVSVVITGMVPGAPGPIPLELGLASRLDDDRPEIQPQRHDCNVLTRDKKRKSHLLPSFFMDS